MNIKDLKFDINDLVKTAGFVAIVIGLRNDIVTEVRSNKVFDAADKQIIGFRLDELEKCCGKQLSAATTFRNEALKPEEVQVPKQYEMN